MPNRASRKLAVLRVKKCRFDPYEPTGGYFVRVKSKERGRLQVVGGKGMTLDPPDQFADGMRLCFVWLTDEQIVEGVKYLKNQEARIMCTYKCKALYIIYSAIA